VTYYVRYGEREEGAVECRAQSPVTRSALKASPNTKWLTPGIRLTPDARHPVPCGSAGCTVTQEPGDKSSNARGCEPFRLMPLAPLKLVTVRARQVRIVSAGRRRVVLRCLLTDRCCQTLRSSRRHDTQQRHPSDDDGGWSTHRQLDQCPGRPDLTGTDFCYPWRAASWTSWFDLEGCPVDGRRQARCVGGAAGRRHAEVC
jgi:hypothetical protein